LINPKDSLEKVEDDLSDSEFEKDAAREQKESSTEKEKTANSEKVLKEISNLKSWFNSDPSRFIEAQDSERDFVVEKADVALSSLNLVEETRTFEEAFYHLLAVLEVSFSINSLVLSVLGFIH
jgi:hypothetical protein